MSYFTFKDETPAADKLERKRGQTGEKTIWYIEPGEKFIYTDIGYKSAPMKSRQMMKRY